MDSINIVNARGYEDFLEIAKCRICLLVSLTPVTCKQCEAVFCKECIENWKKKSNTCPMRCQNLVINEDSRLLKSILSKFRFKCPKCMNEISLDNYFYHDKICAEDLITCQNGCGEILRERFLNTHYKLFCPNSIIKCQVCNSKVKRSELTFEKEKEEYSEDNKNKFKSLENELKLKDEIIHSLKSKLVSLDDKMLINSNINLSNINTMKNNIDTLNIIEIKKINLKEELQINTNILTLVNFMEYFTYNYTNYIILAVTSGDVIIYDITNDKFCKKLKTHNDNFTDFKRIRNAQTGEESIISTSFDSTLATFKIRESLLSFDNIVNKSKLEFPASCLLINEDNDIVVIGDVNGWIRLIQIDLLESIITRKLHRSKIICLEFTKTKEQILTYSKDKTMCIIDLINFNTIKTVALDYLLTSSVMNVETKHLYYIDNKCNIYIYNALDTTNMLKLIYKSTSTNIINSKLFSLPINHEENILVSLNPLDGFKFFLCKNENINLITEKKIADITSFNVVETKDDLMKRNSSNIIEIGSTLSNNLQGSVNNIPIGESKYHFGIFASRTGSLNIFNFK